MARVYNQKARSSKYDRRCSGCGQAIEPGQQVYMWQQRNSARQYRHVDCGYPRPTQLSNRKTAQVEEAAEDALSAVSSWSPQLPEHDADAEEMELDVSELESVLEDAAQVAEDVADEYEEGVSNMPENLQYSSQADAMNEVADELRNWADNLRSPDFDTTVYVVGEAEESDFETAWSDAVAAAQSVAEDALGDVPEYQG